MEFEFKGKGRRILTHRRKATPSIIAKKRKAGDPIVWISPTEAHMTVHDLRLTGNFNLKIEFLPEELRNWLRVYAKQEPEAAIRMLTEMHAEAMIALVQVGKRDALEEMEEMLSDGKNL